MVIASFLNLVNAEWVLSGAAAPAHIPPDKAAKLLHNVLVKLIFLLTHRPVIFADDISRILRVLTPHHLLARPATFSQIVNALPKRLALKDILTTILAEVATYSDASSKKEGTPPPHERPDVSQVSSLFAYHPIQSPSFLFIFRLNCARPSARKPPTPPRAFQPTSRHAPPTLPLLPPSARYSSISSALLRPPRQR